MCKVIIERDRIFNCIVTRYISRCSSRCT